MQHQPRLAHVALLASLSAACKVPQSSDLDTSELCVRYTITTSGEAPPRASVVLRDGENSDYVALSGSDRISCNGTELISTGAGIDHEHGATLKEATAYDFELKRGSGTIVTHVAAPQNFTLSTAPIDATYATKVTIEWAPAVAGTKMRISATPIEQGCGSLSDVVDDHGSYVLDGSSLLPHGGLVSKCNYRIEVRRTETMKLGAPFLGGEADAIHLESLTATFRP